MSNQELTESLDYLYAQEHREGPLGDWFRCQLYYIQGHWPELLALCANYVGMANIEPIFLTSHLRSRAELGDINGLIEQFDQHWPRIEQLPLVYRQLYFVVLFAFTGQTALVERAAHSYQTGADRYTYEFWVATARLVADNRAGAELLLSEIAQHGDEVWQKRVRQRLNHPPKAHPTLSPQAQALLPKIEEAWKSVPALL